MRVVFFRCYECACYTGYMFIMLGLFTHINFSLSTICSHTFVTHLLCLHVVCIVVLVLISWIIIIEGYHFRLLNACAFVVDEIQN